MGISTAGRTISAGKCCGTKEGFLTAIWSARTYLARGRDAYLVLVRAGAAGHSHVRGIGGRRRSWPIRSSGRTRVVLATTPGKADARIADGVALHLVDGHLGSVALDELDETAAFSRGNLDIGDLAETLEERAKLILGDVAGQTADEDGRVVGVGELVHRLRGSSAIESRHRGGAHRRGVHGTKRTRARGHHASMTSSGAALVLRSGGGNAHGSISGIDALHVVEGALLIRLAAEADKAIAARHSRDGIGHDLGRLGRRVLVREQSHEGELVDFGTKVADEDGILRARIAAARVPCQSRYQVPLP